MTIRACIRECGASGHRIRGNSGRHARRSLQRLGTPAIDRHAEHQNAACRHAKHDSDDGIGAWVARLDTRDDGEAGEEQRERVCRGSSECHRVEEGDPPGPPDSTEPLMSDLPSDAASSDSMWMVTFGIRSKTNRAGYRSGHAGAGR